MKKRRVPYTEVHSYPNRDAQIFLEKVAETRSRRNHEKFIKLIVFLAEIDGIVKEDARQRKWAKRHEYLGRRLLGAKKNEIDAEMDYAISNDR